MERERERERGKGKSERHGKGRCRGRGRGKVLRKRHGKGPPASAVHGAFTFCCGCNGGFWGLSVFVLLQKRVTSPSPWPLLIKTQIQIAIFTLGRTIEDRRARMVMIARSKEHGRGFRTSYHDHTSASTFNRPAERKYDNLNLGLILIFRKVSVGN